MGDPICETCPYNRCIAGEDPDMCPSIRNFLAEERMMLYVVQGEKLSQESLVVQERTLE